MLSVTEGSGSVRIAVLANADLISKNVAGAAFISFVFDYHKKKG